ncbi:hypothetical protein CW304_17850 [Bacillus sp. UFRGS-B20]|nr:hypothetical protein CW304_17850 [Bacillus sp. UFRGS-B20]
MFSRECISCLLSLYNLCELVVPFPDGIFVYVHVPFFIDIEDGNDQLVVRIESFIRLGPTHQHALL